MKIIKRPTVPEQTCKRCGCTFEVKQEDFYLSDFPAGETVCKCPFCMAEHRVDFQKQEEQV